MLGYIQCHILYLMMSVVMISYGCVWLSSHWDPPPPQPRFTNGCRNKHTYLCMCIWLCIGPWVKSVVLAPLPQSRWMQRWRASMEGHPLLIIRSTMAAMLVALEDLPCRHLLCLEGSCHLCSDTVWPMAPLPRLGWGRSPMEAQTLTLHKQTRYE